MNSPEELPLQILYSNFLAFCGSLSSHNARKERKKYFFVQNSAVKINKYIISLTKLTKNLI